MPRGIFNWTFADITRFLGNNGFVLGHIEGSHYFYIAIKGGLLRQVCVQFHGNKVLKPRTVKSIILQSGISKSVWLGR